MKYEYRGDLVRFGYDGTYIRIGNRIHTNIRKIPPGIPAKINTEKIEPGAWSNILEKPMGVNQKKDGWSYEVEGWSAHIELPDLPCDHIWVGVPMNLAELRRLEKEATKGPWKAVNADIGHGGDPNITFPLAYTNPINYENAALISALRNAAPALLDLWEAAQGAIRNEGWYSENVSAALIKLEEDK